MLDEDIHRPAPGFVGHKIESWVVEPADLVGVPVPAAFQAAGGGDRYRHPAIQRGSHVPAERDGVAHLEHVSGAHALGQKQHVDLLALQGHDRPAIQRPGTPERRRDA